MKAFQFRLAKVLSWRRTQLELAEAELERERTALRAVQTAMSELTRRDDAVTEAMRRMSSASGADVADIARFREWMSHETRVLQSRHAECERQIEAGLAAVTEARRKVELLERMKERRRGKWDAEFNLELEQLAGESALAAWRRDK